MYKKIDWDAVTITNNFLFQEVFRNKELCKEFIESILHIQIKDIHYPQTEKSVTAQLRSKSIRLDVYVTDTENNVFDVEMQSCGNRSVLYSELDKATVIKELPLRVRYYQSIISTNMLGKGKEYGSLRKAYVIFVCAFDPFNQGLPVYHFTYRSRENPALEMGDQTENIFLNATAAMKAEDKELSAFLAYINGQEATTLFTKKLESEAARIKNREDWRYQIMTLDMEIQVMKRHVAEKARLEGEKEGERRGEERGEKRGKMIGEKRGREAVAMEMLKDGEPIDKITKYSKLTEAAIRKLAKSMGVAVL